MAQTVVTRTVVKRAFRYRFYPTAAQAAELTRTFGCVRLVYNKALAARSLAWTQEQRRIGYAESSALLTGWKRTEDLAFLNEVSSVPLQQGLRHLQRAFAGFFAQRTNFPRFKSRKKSRASAEYTRSGFRYRDGQLTLAKMAEPLAIRWSRPLPEGADPSTVTVSRDSAGRWHCSILVETTIEHLPPTGAEVGIDAGITSLLTMDHPIPGLTDEDGKIDNPRHERRDRVALARAQRVLARKQKGSNNRATARVKVARIHARIADRRRDMLHQLTSRLVRENQTIVIENLAVANMLRNHTLARAISDASWAAFRSMLDYKARWYGRTVIAVDRWLPSSKTCSACGQVKDSMPLRQRVFRCDRCPLVVDRDINAARNIVAAGRAVSACGVGVRPIRP
ncbi:MAG TPA: transposase [Pseudonocardiaceae bacterium]|jgi:putative transposase|nr:transposase [Pseudonocardiaceae bacterium]